MPAEIGDGTPKRLHRAVTLNRASAVPAAPIIHLGEISVSKVRQYPRERGMPVSIGRT